MGLTSANLVYLFFTMLWSLATFTVLLTDVKHYLYSKCVWKYNFGFCDRFLGIEGAYRYTTSIASFYLLMTFATINCYSSLSAWMHKECWVLKFLLFLATNSMGMLFPLTRLVMQILYYTFLCMACFFIVAMFVLLVDCVHTFRLFWIRKAKENIDTPTCYLCTWLFILHILTSILYAISLDLILAFFFFNNIETCINTLLYASLNIFICIIAFGFSYFPTLRDRQAPSQIIFATVLFMVTFSTWITISDPMNANCNMYGTIFTGSILESSVSFRSLASLTVAVPSLLVLCLNNDTPSYIKSLIFADSSSQSWYKYSCFHLTMTGGSSFVLMAVTNFYEPVYTVFNPYHDIAKPIRTSVIYFEGYDQFSYILLCVVSSFLPTFYLVLVVWRIIQDYYITRRLKKKESLDRGSQMSETSEFLYVNISRNEAVHNLRKSPNLSDSATTESSIRFLLLPCFHVSIIQLSFWHFPRNISQTYFDGRNGSNACTIIALIIGRYFSRSDIPFQSTGYLVDTWLNLFHASIKEGNTLYDKIIEDLGILDLSIEEVTERLGSKLNVIETSASLAVSFESDVETATIFYQLRELVKMKKKQVVLFIHKRRTSCFLIYQNGSIIYTDSHAFGDFGSLMITSNVLHLLELVTFLKDVLGSNDNKLATLTSIFYEERSYAVVK